MFLEAKVRLILGVYHAMMHKKRMTVASFF